MPPRLLYDISAIDLEQLQYTLDDIRELNLQRFEFEQLSGVTALNSEEEFIVGVRHVAEDEFWVRGHIPGRPLFPGVLMLEAAAQLCSFYSRKVVGTDGFYGLAGIDEARFRGSVAPGDTLYILGKPQVLTKSRCVFLTQGLVNDRLVFEAKIFGMLLRG